MKAEVRLKVLEVAVCIDHEHALFHDEGLGVVTIDVPDRVTGQVLRGAKHFLFDRSDRRELALHIRRAVRELLLHEIDESIYIDGERIFDPHAEEEN